MPARRAMESPDPGMLLSGDRKVLELIATGTRLGETLDALCDAIDNQTHLVSAVYLLSREGDRFSFAAGPHLPQVWRDATRSYRADATIGACGAAVHLRHPVIVPAVLDSPLFVQWRDAAAASQINSVWSTPFFSKDGHPLGTFAVFAHACGNPDTQHLAVVARATHLASIAVERHVTELELRESERRFSTAFYANPAAMTITRAGEGRFLYVNDAFVRLSGYSRAETIGQTAPGLGLYADSEQRLMPTQLLAERKRHLSEDTIRTKSGEIRDLVRSEQRVELQGEECLLQIAIDITDRKRAEETLAVSEQRWRSVFDNSAIGIVIGDASLNITRTNRAFQELGGYSESELSRMTLLDVTHPDDRHLVTEASKDLLEGRARERQIENRYLPKNGEAIWVRATASLCYEADGSPRVMTLVEDITARKQAQDALRTSEHLLRLVMDAIPVAVEVMDPHGKVLLVNPASTRIWGGPVIRDGPKRYAAVKAWWHNSGRKIEPDEWASVRAVTRGEVSLNEVIDIETFDGRRKSIQNSAVPIRDVHQTIIGAVVVNEDISVRQAAEDALEASANQMRALATRLMRVQDDERRRIAQTLHETTAQDLAGLKMLLARLARTSAALSDGDRAVLLESVDLAERSMSSIRTLSYLLHPPFLDENGLLPALRWYAKGFADRSGIAVELELPPTFERLPQDVETTLFRVVQEALINTHRHAQSATALIRLTAAADRVTLEIEDRGRGMSPEVLASLRMGGGTSGVGIAGMRERLEQLGGHLEIESIDRGTTIRASVPFQARAS